MESDITPIQENAETTPEPDAAPEAVSDSEGLAPSEPVSETHEELDAPQEDSAPADNDGTPSEGDHQADGDVAQEDSATSDLESGVVAESDQPQDGAVDTPTQEIQPPEADTESTSEATNEGQPYVGDDDHAPDNVDRGGQTDAPAPEGDVQGPAQDVDEVQEHLEELPTTAEAAANESTPDAAEVQEHIDELPTTAEEAANEAPAADEGDVQEHLDELPSTAENQAPPEGSPDGHDHQSLLERIERLEAELAAPVKRVAAFVSPNHEKGQDLGHYGW